MSPVLYDYPQRARFGRVVPKNRFYDQGKPSTAVKELFVRQVEQITWAYKLAPETINLPATAQVPEIQVFHVQLKEQELKADVLQCMDQAIPYPLVYELFWQDQVQLVLAHKYPQENPVDTWKVGTHHCSPWVPANTLRQPFPLVLSLEQLYQAFLGLVFPLPVQPGEALLQWSKRIDMVLSQEREIVLLENRLRNEKQFNRKVELNSQLRQLKQAVAQLTITQGASHG